MTELVIICGHGQVYSVRRYLHTVDRGLFGRCEPCGLMEYKTWKTYVDDTDIRIIFSNE